MLEHDKTGKPILVVRGIPKEHTSPAVVVTAYGPEPAKWHEAWLKDLMSMKTTERPVREGDFVAEIDVHLIAAVRCRTSRWMTATHWTTWGSTAAEATCAASQLASGATSSGQ